LSYEPQQAAQGKAFCCAARFRLGDHDRCCVPTVQSASQFHVAKIQTESVQALAEATRKNMRWLEKQNICRLCVAHPKGSGTICAALSVLFSSNGRNAGLWRVGYHTNDPGLVLNLYWQLASEICRELDDGWTINFRGSLRWVLSLFKDFLGATAIPNWRLYWECPSWKPFLWNFAAASKEYLRRSLQRASMSGQPMSPVD
jgi:hypothetical protein